MRRFFTLDYRSSCNFVIYSWVKGINNTAVTLSQDVEQSWGDVQTAYQEEMILLVI
jgi:LemA protein